MSNDTSLTPHCSRGFSASSTGHCSSSRACARTILSGGAAPPAVTRVQNCAAPGPRDAGPFDPQGGPWSSSHEGTALPASSRLAGTAARRQARGVPVPAGVYFVRLRTNAGDATAAAIVPR